MPSKKATSTSAAIERMEAMHMANQGEQPPPEPADPPLQVAITDLGRARMLPLVPDGHPYNDAVEFATATIQQFADEDGSTMRIVNVGGEPHKVLVPEAPAATEEA